jgi:hypothetical protein
MRNRNPLAGSSQGESTSQMARSACALSREGLRHQCRGGHSGFRTRAGPVTVAGQRRSRTGLPPFKLQPFSRSPLLRYSLARMLTLSERDDKPLSAAHIQGSV